LGIPVGDAAQHEPQLIQVPLLLQVHLTKHVPFQRSVVPPGHWYPPPFQQTSSPVQLLHPCHWQFEKQ
jgi:hypothetical protein